MLALCHSSVPQVKNGQIMPVNRDLIADGIMPPFSRCMTARTFRRAEACVS